MKTLLQLALLCALGLCAGAASATTFTDSFAYTTSLTATGNWTNTTAGGYTPLAGATGTVVTTMSTQGLAIATGAGAFANDQTAQTVSTGTDLGGPCVRMNAAGDGYCWYLHYGVLRFTAGGGAGQDFACPSVNSGDTIQLIVSGTTFTCKNVTTSTQHTSTDSTYSSGYPGILVGSGTAFGTFTATAIATAATPTFSPVGPRLPTGGANITISCTTPSSTNYYTTDGSTPTTGSTVYTTPVSITSAATLKALCTASGYVNSMVASQSYTVGSFTWFVRADGGTRYDATYAAMGECDGLADVSYASTGGTGINQHCAYNDVQYMWDPGTTAHVATAWVITGGDTVVIRGCISGPSGSCRLGWSSPQGSMNVWCWAVANNEMCRNPPVPAGTSGHHTIIIGGYAYDHGGNASGGGTQPHTYTANLAKLFGGYDLYYSFDLQSTSYVDVVGIMLSPHNAVTSGNPGYPGNCTLGGSPSYPVPCQTSEPLDDNARNGFIFNNTSTNINLTDVYAYGFSGSGIFGPIGAGITYTRIESSFNAGDAWQLDDGSDTPNGTGSSLTGSYFTAIGNGCYGEWPIVHSFPARACYDGGSAGSGGDTLSGQDSDLQTLVADHFVALYNTKDSFIGPHTQVHNLTITNSYAYGIMGAAWKWGLAPNATVLFQNNVTAFNCARMQAAVPGAVQNFNHTTGLGGSYLSVYCRAGGDGFSTISRIGSTVKFYGNTFIAVNPTIFDINCGYYTIGNIFHQETNCALAFDMQDNSVLGYTDPNIGGAAPGLFFFDPGMMGAITVNSQWSNEYGIRNGSTCGVNHVTCVDPLMQSQPATPWPGAESDLDVFDPFAGSGNSFYPTMSSALLGAGTTLGGLTLDYYGTTRPSPPAMGGVELGGGMPTAATPVSTPPAPTYSGPATTLTYTCSTPSSSIYYTTGGGTPGTLYTTGISITTTSTYRAQCRASGYTDSAISSTALTIVPTGSGSTSGGTLLFGGTYRIQ